MRPVYWIVFAMGSLLQVTNEFLLSQVNSNAGYNMYRLTLSDLGDLKHSMPGGGGGFRPPVYLPRCLRYGNKFATKVVHYISNDFLKQ